MLVACYFYFSYPACYHNLLSLPVPIVFVSNEVSQPHVAGIMHRSDNVFLTYDAITSRESLLHGLLVIVITIKNDANSVIYMNVPDVSIES